MMLVRSGLSILMDRPRLYFNGSAQQSDERRILGSFPESDEFGLGGGQPLCLQ